MNNLLINNRSISVIAFSLICTTSATTAMAKDNLDISGYLMLDHHSFDGTFVEHDDESQAITDIRRARLSFKSQPEKNWQAKLQLGFADGDTEIKDAYLRYNGLSFNALGFNGLGFNLDNFATLTLGKQKEAFGLEKQISSKNLALLERSLITEALAPGRSLGISLAGELDSFTWQIGLYQPENNSSALTGQVTWQPWQAGNNHLHLGASFSERSYDANDSSEFRINEPLEIAFSDSLFESETLTMTESSLQGVEFLWQQNGFTTMAEWQQASITNDSGANHEYNGGYLQLSYALSGTQRSYQQGKLGKFNGKGWELTSRYSTFNMESENKTADITTVGATYHASKKLSFKGNYIYAEHRDETEHSGSGISLRAQYRF